MGRASGPVDVPHPAGVAIMPPELADDLDDDLGRFEAEFPVPAARPGRPPM
jgi:hypothetical protein